jgi:hypothetical protein
MNSIEQEIEICARRPEWLMGLRVIIGWKAICKILGTKDRKSIYKWIKQGLQIETYSYKIIYITIVSIENWLEQHPISERISQKERTRRSRWMKQIRKPGPGRGNKSS